MKTTPLGGLFAILSIGIPSTCAQIDIRSLVLDLTNSGAAQPYKCPRRSRVQLHDAPLVADTACPQAMDKRYAASGDKTFYILCCRHVDDGKKALSIVPGVPSLQVCIAHCAQHAGCKSVLYTAREGSNSNYPLQTCELFAAGDYGKQSPCNNDAHDSAFLIEPPLAEHISVDVSSGQLPFPGGPAASGTAWVRTPGTVDAGCAQSFIDALRRASISCSSC
ncbi:hypothetical protein JHW43_007060 [Diplocarpon mali]|nr:hypothetical protein JHW43_007060 [Diplocarpon mali]